MAVRLQMKLGVVAEHDRLADSPDTLVVVEPSVGSVARSKGHLYLLVTSRISSRHALEATRLAAETIRNEYYYDESAGIRVCLQKAIGDRQQAARPPGRPARAQDVRTATGRSASAVAVVRGNEMYVATVGPAEAYLIRQARLSTLPDPHRERGLPSAALEPDVWRGEISVGDSLVLVSPNVIAKLGAGRAQGRDAHAPPAVGDGAPPPPLRRRRRLRQRRRDRVRGDRGVVHRAGPGRSCRSGRPSRSPARPTARRSRSPTTSRPPASRSARRRAAPASPPAARSSASSRGSRTSCPSRKPAYRRVTPLASRRETQRRAALADPRPRRRRRRARARRSTRSAAARRSRRSARSTPARRRSTRRRRTWPRSPVPASTSSRTTPTRRSSS